MNYNHIKKYLIPFDKKCPPWSTLHYEPIGTSDVIMIQPTDIWKLYEFISYVLKCVDLDRMLDENAIGYPIFSICVHLLLDKINKINKLDVFTLYYETQSVQCGNNMYIN